LILKAYIDFKMKRWDSTDIIYQVIPAKAGIYTLFYSGFPLMRE
jgi:hypothetical protein